MRLRNAALIALVFGCSLTALAQGPGPRRDGKWEVTMKMEMPGMPMAMPATTTTQCITPAQAADPQNTIPQNPQGRGRGRGNAPKCTMTDYKTVGNKVNFVMTCEPPDASTMTGEMVYGVDTYTGTMKMEMGRGGQSMVMNMNYTGKRLGDCTE